jgi:hypothetical protein
MPSPRPAARRDDALGNTADARPRPTPHQRRRRHRTVQRASPGGIVPTRDDPSFQPSWWKYRLVRIESGTTRPPAIVYSPVSGPANRVCVSSAYLTTSPKVTHTRPHDEGSCRFNRLRRPEFDEVFPGLLDLVLAEHA